MRFRGPAIVFAALLIQSAWAAETCIAGRYLKDGTNCTPCPPGHISINDDSSFCTPCDAGYESRSDHKSCKKCQPGEFNPTPGEMCQRCLAGQFNSVSGAKSCCDCCAGWYSTDLGSTSCMRCPLSARYGPVASHSSSECQGSQVGVSKYKKTCHMKANNACPATTRGGPKGSPITRKRRELQCSGRLDACPRYSGRGGFDCVDTKNDPESCGGCVGPDGEGPGTDCTAIMGGSATRCVKGSCVIDSCRKGWIKSLDSTSCPKAKKERSSAKGVLRANIY